MNRVIDDIIRDVAELPDRTSPEDWPDAMLVTADELRVILSAHLPAFSPPIIKPLPPDYGKAADQTGS